MIFGIPDPTIEMVSVSGSYTHVIADIREVAISIRRLNACLVLYTQGGLSAVKQQLQNLRDKTGSSSLLFTSR